MIKDLKGRFCTVLVNAADVFSCYSMVFSGVSATEFVFIEVYIIYVYIVLYIQHVCVYIYKNKLHIFVNALLIKFEQVEPTTNHTTNTEEYQTIFNLILQFFSFQNELTASAVLFLSKKLNFIVQKFSSLFLLHCCLALLKACTVSCLFI